MIQLVMRLLTAIVIAFFIGKLVSKMKLPAILGWLLTGMILGPHAVGIVNESLLNASWYRIASSILECAVGLMIGTELVLKKLKESGKQIIITTLTQSLGTFFLVTLFFGIIFHFMNIPIYLAFIFGGIALATAPAPALSIVKEFKTDGPVTRTLIPMAALDDIVGIIVFFSVITFVTAGNTEQSTPLYLTLAMMILLPLVIGAVIGLVAGIFLKQERSNNATLLITIVFILVVATIGLIFNNLILPEPMLNFMLIGMAFSAVFSNMVSEERLEQIMNSFNPILGLSMIIVILNLGAPLDYHLILGAGIFTAIYIISRAIGKYSGAYFGAKITGLPQTVEKYLGLTLLPHSGVSLVFTGIAVTSISGFDPDSAAIIQGTIAAAAVINEVIAVIISKKAFEWAGEFGKLENGRQERIE
ncbi:cation:proton antiporter [Tissierella sp. MB52-C2]|uniref:cation:proton antiporter n=1 Tax=Tissierella sp. MB52-C2 TaxID=3070999 RepID=UPI00280C31E5|nr:cation:proton antiporter [Tissierella sp. MB52-C2]WMM24937.1 cation:proton antiporter [Tissierella sp. MB52-C2]